jgi:mercuric ion transport protein
MATITTNEARPQAQPIPRAVWLARVGYAICTWLFVGCIITQVFLAGSAALISADYWAWHRAFPQIMRLFPIAMLLIGLASRLPRRMLALTALALGLFVMQYIFIWVFGSIGLGGLRGLHAVNALALFWLALRLGQRSWGLLRSGSTRH